jgi:YfiH family protein
VYGAFNLGPHVGDDPVAVARRREALAEHLGLPRIQWLAQLHGVGVLRAAGAQPLAAGQDSPPGSDPEADALWTDEPGLGLAIMTADCLPALLWSDQGRWVAALHGGWRGLVAGVIGTTLAALQDGGCDLRSPWQAWLGPTISAARYEVDEPVFAAVRAGLARDGLSRQAPRVLTASAERHGRWQLDLVALARAQLESAGCGGVHGGDECTRGLPRYYSHRGAGAVGARATGRQASLIWIQPPG